MTAFRLILCAFAVAISAAAIAQEQPSNPTAPPAAPTTAADCTRPLARHDHSAERGTPSPQTAAPCAAAPRAVAAKTRPKAIVGHDHGKFHKNQ